MRIRKLKHKGKFWRDDEVYGEQMHYFIAQLPALPPHFQGTSLHNID